MTTKTTPAVVVSNRFPGVETPDGTFSLDEKNWLRRGAQVQESYDPEDQF